MDENDSIRVREEKLKRLKLLLSSVDEKLQLLAKELNWDYKKLLEENPSSMVTCSINPLHRVPCANIQFHEKKCSWGCQGYKGNDKIFPEFSGAGSSVTLTPELIFSITQNVTYTKDKGLRAVPQTSDDFDQNFDREEKLAIYDYVIANSQKQESYPDLWLQYPEKTEKKKEAAAWEIAAAERDAKRRRASYRNKVHTNRKTHTEILREVIESQMETLKEERKEKCKGEKHKTNERNSSYKARESESKRTYSEFCRRRSKDDPEHRRHSDKYHKHERSPYGTGSDAKSRSRSNDKYRKWKSREGRSHSRRSSHARSTR